MEQITLMVHLLVALALIALILLQRGKGSDIGASFGAGASQTLFGSAGSGNALTRMTAWLSAVFFISSFGLAVIADNRTADEDDLGFEVPVHRPRAGHPARRAATPGSGWRACLSWGATLSEYL